MQTPAPKQDPLTFSKMAGGGNDFVVIDNRAGRIGEAIALTRRICTPHLSVGADGVILIENTARATFRMRYLNADGSAADFCANGTRCAARFAFVNVIAPKRMTIETGAGVVGAEVSDGGHVTLTLPPPGALQSRALRVGEATIHGSSIVVGVPHFVIFLRDNLWSQDIVALGRALRAHPDLQPEGANINFVVVRERGSIEVRTYERGVEAETLSCGSGVVASAVTSALFRKTDSPVKVLTRSGITLEVSFALNGGAPRDLQLRGDARIVYRAAMTSETIEGFDPEWVRNPAENAMC